MCWHLQSCKLVPMSFIHCHVHASSKIGCDCVYFTVQYYIEYSGSVFALPSLGFSRQEHRSGLPFPSPMHKSEKWKWSRSVVSDSQRPHGLQPTRLLHPWIFQARVLEWGAIAFSDGGSKLFSFSKRDGVKHKTQDKSRHVSPPSCLIWGLCFSGGRCTLSEKTMAPHSSTLAWKIHGWRSLVGCSPWGRWVGHDWATSLSRIGEGSGNPLQGFCLENLRDGGAWWVAVYGVAQNGTWLNQFSSSSSSSFWTKGVI